VLVSELQHRTRNLLAVVRAIAAHSFAGQIADCALDGFFQRLSSLGRVQGLISRAEGERVKLADIVRAELEAYGHTARLRLEMHGPTVRLANHQVQVIALALHELVTNAVKYGALQAPEGKLSVTWETWLGAQGRQRLALLWRESGVTMPPHAGMRRGQGRELIENALRFSLHADTQLVFAEDGVWCRIELPVDRRGGDRLDPRQVEAGG
jgi:two-component system, chemotaxis family, CheB/CheR fusion protein